MSSKMLTQDQITGSILFIRGHRVMLDSDLALLYCVTTKQLNQQVKRNLKRFPADFMFRLSPKEKEEVVTNCDHLKVLRFSPHLPYAFTEHGAIMLASILNSEAATHASVQVVRAFIRLRQILSGNKSLALKLQELESKVGKLDDEMKVIFDAIRQLMIPIEKSKRRIGFHPPNQEKGARSRKKRV